MNMASVIWNWTEDDRVYSRLTTNVARDRLIARLRMIKLLDLIETIHAYFGDRVYGGSGYEVLWKKHVRLDDLRGLERL